MNDEIGNTASADVYGGVWDGEPRQNYEKFQLDKYFTELVVTCWAVFHVLKS